MTLRITDKDTKFDNNPFILFKLNKATFGGKQTES